MTSLRQRAAQGLKVGDSFTLSRLFSDADIQDFAKISRDYNPVHCDARFAEARGFRAPVSHGLLTASLLTEIGGQIGWLAAGMTFDFKKPVYAGDRITGHWLITEITHNTRAAATVTMTNEDGVVVLQAHTRGILPRAEEREILSRMLAEGDPSNGAREVCALATPAMLP